MTGQRLTERPPWPGTIAGSRDNGYVRPVFSVEGIYRQARSMEVHEIMTRRVWSVGRDAPIEEAVRLMLDRGIDHVPVVDGKRPVGMIAHRDLLKLLLGSPPTI